MKDVQQLLLKITSLSKRYIVIVVMIIFGAMYAYLITTSGKHASEQPSQAQIDERFKATARPKIDENAAKKLTELEEQNIEVQAIFDRARNNPFVEE